MYITKYITVNNNNVFWVTYTNCDNGMLSFHSNKLEKKPGK